VLKKMFSPAFLLRISCILPKRWARLPDNLTDCSAWSRRLNSLLFVDVSTFRFPRRTTPLFCFFSLLFVCFTSWPFLAEWRLWCSRVGRRMGPSPFAVVFRYLLAPVASKYTLQPSWSLHIFTLTRNGKRS
jgi:hypothetical protein